MRIFYGMLDQANVNCFILYTLNENNLKMKRIDFVYRLCEELVKPLLLRRLTLPSLRINLRMQIEEYVDSKDLPEDQDVRDFLAENKMAKQKRCDFCPSTLDRKTYYKCLRCDKPMCRSHVAKIYCECSINNTE